MKVVGLRALADHFRQKAQKAKENAQATVIVGYSAAYALFVHENLEMKWKGLPRKGSKAHGVYWGPNGQAKFLETPARENGQKMKEMIAKGMLKGLPIAQVMMMVGLFLQRESQKLVPVVTGNLRNSAFTRLE